MNSLPAYEEFQQQLGQPFLIHYNPAQPPLEIVLETISDINTLGRGFKAYSMVFTSENKGFLAQATWMLQNQALGEFPLFLVPGGPDESGERFEYNVSITFAATEK